MPMWSSVANLKESLSKIALDVHDDDDEELSMYNTPPPRDQFSNGNSVSERRASRNFTRSNTPTHSPVLNGFDSPSNHEVIWNLIVFRWFDLTVFLHLWLCRLC